MVLVRITSRILRPGLAIFRGANVGRTRRVLIEDIDEPVPNNAYILRPGACFVDHRIAQTDGIIRSALALRACADRFDRELI
jgi:hypothetical protein